MNDTGLVIFIVQIALNSFLFLSKKEEKQENKK